MLQSYCGGAGRRNLRFKRPPPLTDNSCQLMPIDWKRSAVVGASFGLAVAVALIAAAGLFYWYSSRPQPWDASTVRGISTTVSQTFDLDEQHKQFTASGFMLVFVLENTSRRDYTVPQNLRLFERSSKTGALEEVKGKFDHSFVIPAKDKTEVNASIEYGCSDEDLETGKTTERDGPTCFKDAFGDVTGFVGFDDSTHTRLNLPKPVFYGGSSAPVNASKDLPPDKGDIFNRVAGCQKAERLANLCKAQHINVGKDNVAFYNGWETPLPSLPTPPTGYELDPSPSDCGTAYQWQNFCRAQK